MSSLGRDGGRIVVALVLILFVGFVSACGGKKAEQPPVADLVARTTAAMKAEKRFHFVFDEEHGPKSTSGVHLVFAEGDVSVPDRVKADVSGTFQGVPIRSRLVGVGGRVYLEEPFTGSWQEVSIKTNPVAFFDPAKGVLAVIEDATQLEVTGSEKLDGVDAYHLRGKTTVGSIAPLLGNTPGTRLVELELWVDKKTDRLLRLRLSGEVEDGDPTEAVRTIDLSRYGVVVPIVAPTTGA